MIKKLGIIIAVADIRKTLCVNMKDLWLYETYYPKKKKVDKAVTSVM